MANTIVGLNYLKLVELIKANVLQYDTTFVNNIPNFIALAEYRCSRDCKIVPLKVNTTTASVRLPKNTFTIQKPYNWYRTLYITAQDEVGNVKSMQKRDASVCQYINGQLDNDPIDFFSDDLYYADDYNQTEYYFCPSFDFDLNLTISYYELSSNLSEQTPTNTLTQNIPDLLLSASLINAFRFVNNQILLAKEEENYNAILNGYSVTDAMRTVSDYDTNKRIK